MIFAIVYQLFHNFFNIDTSAFFIPATITTTRGHNYKLFKSHTRCLARTNFFSNHVIKDWNHLPNDVVNVETLNILLNLYQIFIGLDSFIYFCSYVANHFIMIKN